MGSSAAREIRPRDTARLGDFLATAPYIALSAHCCGDLARRSAAAEWCGGTTKTAIAAAASFIFADMLFLRDEYGMPVARICPGGTERNQGPVYLRPHRLPGFRGAFPLLTLTDGAGDFCRVCRWAALA